MIYQIFHSNIIYPIIMMHFFYFDLIFQIIKSFNFLLNQSKILMKIIQDIFFIIH